MVGCHHRHKGMSLSKLWETVKDKEDWRAAVHGFSESDKALQVNNPPHPNFTH